MNIGTWLGIAAIVVSSLVTFLLWACCRVGAQADRKMESWLLVGIARGRTRRYDGRPDTRDWLADEGLDERDTAGDLGRGQR